MINNPPRRTSIGLSNDLFETFEIQKIQREPAPVPNPKRLSDNSESSLPTPIQQNNLFNYNKWSYWTRLIPNKMKVFFKRTSSLIKKSPFLINTIKRLTIASPFMYAGTTVSQKSSYSTFNFPTEPFEGFKIETTKPGDGK